jgi:Doubled CXXCH motif (Paired_CXXCH_1)
MTNASRLAAASLAAGGEQGEARPGEAQPEVGRPAGELVEAAPPPFSEGIFPCSQCHQGQGDRQPRELGFHEDIQDRLRRHAPQRRWCLDCHDFGTRDMLHLSSGELVPFTESYRVCAQCHYDKYRDWRLGIHGKRVGRWNGPKTYLLCVNCHDPHSPRFKPLAPERPPRRPEDLRR